MNAPDRYVPSPIIVLCFFFCWISFRGLVMDSWSRTPSHSKAGAKEAGQDYVFHFGAVLLQADIITPFMLISLLHTAVCKCVSSSYSSPAASGSCPHFELACFLELRGIYAVGKIVVCKHSGCFIFPLPSHFKFLCSISSMLSFFDHHLPFYFNRSISNC